MARPQEFDKADVLHRSTRLFWRKGYEATSLADILEATGLSKSSLYATFGNKHDLFLSGFDSYRADRKHDMDLVLSRGSAREGIEAFFRMIISDAGSLAAGDGCMSINQAVELAPHDDTVKRRVAEDFQLIEDALAAAVERGQREGSIGRYRSARDLAGLLVLCFPGLQIMARLGLRQEQADDALEQLLGLLD